jgi:hypothetical protein
MDDSLLNQSEIALRRAGYDTWPWSNGLVPVICFENDTVVGFVHVFADADDLHSRWLAAQATALDRHATALRRAGDKAWNVYSIFLTASSAPASIARAIERIEEDFTMTRKIARTGVVTAADVARALLPLLPIQSKPVLDTSNYGERLGVHLVDVQRRAVAAFLSEAKPADIVQILAEPTR